MKIRKPSRPTPTKQQLAAMPPPPASARAVSVDHLAQILGLSRSKAYDLVNSGKVASISIGSSRRVPVKSIDQYIDAQTTD